MATVADGGVASGWAVMGDYFHGAVPVVGKGPAID